MFQTIFQPITNAFTWVFNALHSLIVSCGVDADSGLSYVLAIAILTVIIRGVLLPFNIKAAKSNQRMQEVQPELKKLQKKYKNDPQKLNEEMMKLYKEKNVSMTGGCLPSFFQFYYPKATITAVDIDEEVIRVAKEYFRLNPSIQTVNADALTFIKEQEGKSTYDYIFVDIDSKDPKSSSSFPPMSFLTVYK